MTDLLDEISNFIWENFKYLDIESNYSKLICNRFDANLFGIGVPRDSSEQSYDVELIKTIFNPEGNKIRTIITPNILYQIHKLLKNNAKPFLYRRSDKQINGIFMHENILMIAVGHEIKEGQRELLEILKNEFIDFWQEDFFDTEETLSWYSFTLKYGTDISKQILLCQSLNPLQCLLEYQSSVSNEVFRESISKLCKDKKWSKFKMKNNFEEQLDECFILGRRQSRNNAKYWKRLLNELGLKEKIHIQESILSNALLLRTVNVSKNNEKWFISKMWFDELKNKNHIKQEQLSINMKNTFFVKTNENLQFKVNQEDEYLKTFEKYTKRHGVTSIEIDFGHLIAIGGEAILMNISPKKLNIENSISNYAVKFSPTMLSYDTVLKLKDIFNEIYAKSTNKSAPNQKQNPFLNKLDNMFHMKNISNDETEIQSPKTLIKNLSKIPEKAISNASKSEDDSINSEQNDFTLENLKEYK